ncbi:hypothetical protein PPERSA_03798 [Pseudocohnilembus persalinus]|uniref:Uncharacterized protein n=1 Tax=Pseudocohnilembus persalinus TaxID=266149 RepID=A0A0V0QVF0_PSEPJ|nr:hypothetical protein PPERSA_03798 [Pseudocohnilembus persalinus]|eukprot:KRX05861.1 hypothetical protein PPERSA_03798 [Pseudocohnilembus persalinus]
MHKYMGDLLPQQFSVFKQTQLPKIILPLQGIKASTQDFNQSIDQTLNKDEHTFWSSLGTVNSNDRDEYLIYQFQDAFCFVNEVTIKFFYAYFQEQPVYLSKQVKLELYTEEDKVLFSKTIDIQNMPLNQNLTSPEIEQYMTHRIEINKPILAKFIKLIFIGKYGIQQSDEQYYIAVENVKAIGHLFNQEKLDFRYKSKQFLEKQYKEIKEFKEQILDSFQNFQLYEQSQYEDEEQQDIEIENEEQKSEQKKEKKIKEKIQNYEQFMKMRQKQIFTQNVQNLQEMQNFFEKFPSAFQNFDIYLYINEKKNKKLKQRYFDGIKQGATHLTELETYVYLVDEVKFIGINELNQEFFELLSRVQQFIGRLQNWQGFNFRYSRKVFHF